jgi:hypothetical protein
MMCTMGTWGKGALDNDAALDFIGDLEDGPASGRVQMIHERLRGVADRVGYLEGSDADEALAAALLVLVAGGGAVPEALGSTSAAAGVVSTLPRPDAELIQQARAAVRRITSNTDNEWIELWAEAGELEEATARLLTLVHALEALPAPQQDVSAHPTNPAPDEPPSRRRWWKRPPGQ